MADSDAQDRNLPASARKLARAREEGQVPRSRDLGHFLSIGVGVVLLAALASRFTDWAKTLLVSGLRFDAATLLHPEIMLDRLLDMGGRLLLVVVPLGLLMALVGVASCLAVGGWNFSTKALAPKFNKLNPLTGFAQLFSGQQLVQTLKGCALALVLGVIGYFYLKSEVGVFVQLTHVDLSAGVNKLSDTIYGGLLLLLLVLGVFAAIDAPLQRVMYLRQLRMSREEMKQEHKEQEGNQEVKGKMKARMREMSRRRMLSAVPTADLVVMNPTHYAVALKYDEHSMGAPKVVAKGADLLAMNIRDAAKKAKVPVLQAPVLARALYAHAKLDREIPAVLFAAVAQVLAYVFQLRAAMRGLGPMPGDLPPLKVPPELDPHNTPAPGMEAEV
jgi:flagellar biosynthetic protein FlhB